MNERVAIIDGTRSPMAKAGTVLNDVLADDLGAVIVKELFRRNYLADDEIDEVIIGNVSQPAHAANIARVIALKAGLSERVPAYTVHRNCASGMESITGAASKMAAGKGKIYIVGGVESMSNIPFTFPKEFQNFMGRMQKSKSLPKKLGTALSFRPRMLKPTIGLVQGLTDPVSGLIMGLTAENLAREFKISRERQDEFALRSHNLAVQAQEDGILADEITPIPAVPDYSTLITEDIGPRKNQSMEQLARLSPYFDRRNGTVTVGSSAQVTDGAAALLLMPESEAKARGLEPLGYLRDWAYAGLDPARMGLGPAYATSVLMASSGVTMKDLEYIEINEAFAAQVIAVEEAFKSKEFAKTELGRSQPLGEIDRNLLNLQGGAIALGHPVGMTGTRIVLHTLKELRRQGKNTGLAALCVGGGQGAALLLEVA